MKRSFRTGHPRWRVVFACVSLLMLASCSERPSEPLRIASSPWPGYEPIYLAREIGYLPPSKATIYELPSSDITLESFRNGSADMATLTLDEVLELMHGGVKLRVLMVLDGSNGADAVMASPKIKKLSDLKGKRIAIENIPLGVYMLSRLLTAANLKREDVQILPVSENKHEEMYRQGKADAFITFDPMKTKLTQLGAHAIFDSSDIPNEIFDLMVVHEDIYLNRHKEVCDVAKQWFRTLAYMKQSPAEAAVIVSKRLDVTPKEYEEMLKGIKTPELQENLTLISGNRPEILKAGKLLNDVMIREGQLTHQIALHLGLDPNLKSCIGD
ncbi:MAG: NitT/TauT family transport system substrate-binding protein [Gallionellaceae bacterium]|nr:MAG: NitT/TauT family transport system substrate-binding protein [Gallionellaceae bacterium]